MTMRFAILASLLVVGCGGSVSNDPVVSSDAATDTFTPPADSHPPPNDAGDPPVDAGATPLTINGEGLSAYDGKTIWFLVQNRAVPGLLAKGSGVIMGGKVTVTIPRAMPPDHFGVGLDVFVDLDNNGTCTGTEPTWFDIVPTMWGTGTMFTFTPRDESKRTCAEIGT